MQGRAAATAWVRVDQKKKKKNTPTGYKIFERSFGYTGVGVLRNKKMVGGEWGWREKKRFASKLVDRTQRVCRTRTGSLHCQYVIIYFSFRVTPRRRRTKRNKYREEERFSFWSKRVEWQSCFSFFAISVFRNEDTIRLKIEKAKKNIEFNFLNFFRVWS